jgi:16S rRNA (uracil1498-N3)-methyltransferase
MSPLRRLFSIEPLTEPGAVVRLDPDESHHGRCVLRLRAGDRTAVFDSAGSQFVATIQGVEDKRLLLVLAKPLAAAPEPPIPISLYLALTKGEAFDSILQRAVELGAAEIVPFVAERSVPTVGRGKDLERKVGRWRQILLSATKQCGRARLTAVTAPCPFNEAIARPDAGSLRFCCAPDAAAPKFSEMLRSLSLSSAQSLAIMIGPEGGLTDGEITTARDHGWHLVSLGPRILRVETAATAALTRVLVALGDL